MSYLSDKRRRLGGRELTQPGQVQNTGPVQKQVTPAPKAVQTTAQRPQVQTQAAAPKAMEQQTRGQTAPATQSPVPVQTTGQDAVAAAQNLLSQQLGNYQSQYGSQIDSLIQQLQGQQPFTYDVNTDPLYLQLRDQWMRDGKLAMEDTMGQAAQLTGGYGNSYAQTAGQQMYNGYLREVNDMIPQLKEAARADYDAENAYLMQQLGLLMDQDSQDYSRWMDELQRQQYAEQLEYDRGRDALADQRYEQEWQYQQGQDAYERLLEMIVTTGYKPTAEELAAAGMTDAQAKAWRGYWQRQQAASGGSGGGGGSSSRRSSSSGGGGQATPAVSDVVNAAIDNLFGAQKKNGAPSDAGMPKDYAGVEAECKVFKANGAPNSMVAEYLGDALSGGIITKGQYNTLMKKYGGQEKKDSESSLYLSPVGGSGRGTYSRFN